MIHFVNMATVHLLFSHFFLSRFEVALALGLVVAVIATVGITVVYIPSFVSTGEIDFALPLYVSSNSVEGVV